MIDQHCPNCRIAGSAQEILPCPECGEMMHVQPSPKLRLVDLEPQLVLHLIKTCDACPEQYDVCLGPNGEQVGYLRLRHGRFVVQAPDVGQHTLFIGYPRGEGFFEADERDYYLAVAVKAIEDWLKAGRPAGPALPPRPNVKYVVISEWEQDV